MESAWPEVALGGPGAFKYGKSLPASTHPGDGPTVVGSNGPVGHDAIAPTHGPTILVGRKDSSGEVHYSEAGCWPIDSAYIVGAASTSSGLRWQYYRMCALGCTGLNRAAAAPGLNRDHEHTKNKGPDPPARWSVRSGAERDRERTEQSFCVPNPDGYDRSINRYKELIHEEVEHRDPRDIIIKELHALADEIRQGLTDLESML